MNDEKRYTQAELEESLQRVVDRTIQHIALGYIQIPLHAENEALRQRVQALEGALRQVLCQHVQRSGGNDYMECSDCALMWDYRSNQQPQDVARMLGAAALSPAPAGEQEQS